MTLYLILLPVAVWAFATFLAAHHNRDRYNQ